MRLLDLNVLIAAHRSDHPHQPKVRPWVDRLLADGEGFAVPELVRAGFIRIVTSPRALVRPTSLADAFGFLRTLIDQPGHVPLVAGPRHPRLFERTCLDAEATGDLVPDAFLAALAIEHGATVVSLDRDFARFDGLRWERPG